MMPAREIEKCTAACVQAFLLRNLKGQDCEAALFDGITFDFLSIHFQQVWWLEKNQLGA